jgi:cystathionine beta-lyase
MYNFDEIVDRRRSNSYKWDEPQEEGILPMWVADMDFKAAPAIIDALKNVVERGVFGYTYVPNEYYEAIIKWFDKYHNWKIQKDSIIYTSGVVPAVSAIIKGLTHPGDAVVVQPPVYNCFFSSIRNNGCEIIENSLIYEDNTYRINFEELDSLTSLDKVKILLLCNPHNPAGRAWTQSELLRIGEICLKNNVVVVSDEIHCELVYAPYKYTPYASIGDKFAQQSISCVSPTKAFNIAGLQIANIVTDNIDFRKKIDRAINDNEVCDVNPFGVVALIAAYNESASWLKELVEYLKGNYEHLKNVFSLELPMYNVIKLEATYLAWIDCSVTQLKSQDIAELLLDKAKVMINPGIMYGKDGDDFIRINLACPRSVLNEALQRIVPVLRSLCKN